VAAALLLWLLLGDLALLGLAELFPRYVFAIGPGSGWFVAACLAAAYFVARRTDFRAAGAEVTALLNQPRRRRLAVGAAALTLFASVLIATSFPAGVDAELLHPDGTRSAVGRRADFDLDRHELVALATYPRTKLHMTGYLVPGWALPWPEQTFNVLTHWHVTAPGVFDLRFNPYVRIQFNAGDTPDAGVVRIADLGPRGDVIEMTFEPFGPLRDGALSVVLEHERLPWHLFSRPVSLPMFWVIVVQRLLLAALIIVGAPLLVAVSATALSSRMARRRWAAARLPLLYEAAAVCALALIYLCTLAPRVQTSATADQAAFVNWADYCERGQLAQTAPDWARRWAGTAVGAYVSLAAHAALPPAPGSDATALRMVDAKPIGLPLLLVLARALFGESSTYYVSAWMAALSVVALYAAARVSGIGRFLSLVGASSLALSGALVHNATVLDPDAAATAWASVLLFVVLLMPRYAACAVLAGVAFGMACLTRYNAALALLLVVPFLLREPRRIVPFILAGLPFLALLLAVNWQSYGGPFDFPYRAFAADLMSVAKPYSKELGGYLKAFVVDLSPALGLPFLALPFIRSVAAVERVALFLFVTVWFAFFGTIAKVDPYFLRHLLPVYPAIILGSLHVWRWLAAGGGLRRPLVLGAVALLTVAWLPRGLVESPEPPDTSRVAAAWVDFRVPPRGVVLTDQLMNNAIYYYTGHRHFPLTLMVPRIPAVDLAALRRAAHAAGNWDDWFLIVHRSEVAGFRSTYPELQLEELHAGPTWDFYRVAAIAGSD